MENNSVKDAETSLESLYLKKDFKGAKEYLLKHRDNFNSGQFHYNLGTIDLKNGDFASARYHLELALQNGHVHPKVYKNLSISTELLQVKSSEAQMTYPEQFLFMAKSVPQDGLISMSLILFLLMALAWYRKWMVKAAYYWTLAITALLPLALYLALTQLHVGIVLKEASLREGPSAVFGETTKIPAGHKIILGEESGQWQFVHAPLKFAGWIEKTQLGNL